MDKIQLFCLPYAGGSAVVYREWTKYLHDSIELNAIELAGRSTRFKVPFYESFNEAISDIYNRISEKLDGRPYAILGHSMGSALAFELAHKLKNLHHAAPLHMFFSGRCPPQKPRDKNNIHLLPDKEFIKKIMEMGGTPKELLQDKELLELFTPILRADFKLIETYKYIEKNEKLDSDITILWGKQEENATVHDLYEWENHTTKKCKIKLFNGGHFFIHECISDVVNIVNSQLLHSGCK